MIKYVGGKIFWKAKVLNTRGWTRKVTQQRHKLATSATQVRLDV